MAYFLKESFIRRMPKLQMSVCSSISMIWLSLLVEKKYNAKLETISSVTKSIQDMLKSLAQRTG